MMIADINIVIILFALTIVKAASMVRNKINSCRIERLKHFLFFSIHNSTLSPFSIFIRISKYYIVLNL